MKNEDFFNYIHIFHIISFVFFILAGWPFIGMLGKYSYLQYLFLILGFIFLILYLYFLDKSDNFVILTIVWLLLSIFQNSIQLIKIIKPSIKKI